MQQDVAAVAWATPSTMGVADRTGTSNLYIEDNVFLNFTGLADEPRRAHVNNAFGRNLRRLGQIKATYDPDNEAYSRASR